MIRNSIAILISITSFLFFYINPLDAGTNKKKLFIYRITPESGISRSLSKKTRDYMILSILERYKNIYQLVTDDDIRIMYRKAEEIQASGCDDQACVMQIADAIDADEIIYGAMSREGGKLRISIQNLQRDRKTLGISKKSMVNISFFESQLRWYCSEIVKKLIFPDYEVDFKLDSIGYEGLDIGVLKFKTSDESLSMLIDYFKEITETGDEFYKKGDFEEARSKYMEVIDRINEKLRDKSKTTISKFTSGIYERIASIYEAEGDGYYSEYKFGKALKRYNKGIEIINTSGSGDLYEKRIKLTRKRNMAVETGTSWLENKVRSNCNQAEYLNVRDQKEDAIDILERTGWLISTNDNFSNSRIQSIYNHTCRLIGFDSKEINEDVQYYINNRGNYYGTLTLGFTGLTAASLGIGYFFNTKVSTANSDYEVLKSEYKASEDFDEATRLHDDMDKKKEEAASNALYRNVSYGVGIVSTLFTVYFAYQYFSFKSIESKIQSEYASISFHVLPLYSYHNYSNNDKDSFPITELTLAAFVCYRF